MRVATDTRHSFESKIEGSRRKPGPGEKGNEKGPQTAVDVERERLSKSETGEGGNVIDNTVRKGGGGADEEDRVTID